MELGNNQSRDSPPIFETREAGASIALTQCVVALPGCSRHAERPRIAPRARIERIPAKPNRPARIAPQFATRPHLLDKTAREKLERVFAEVGRENCRIRVPKMVVQVAYASVSEHRHATKEVFSHLDGAHSPLRERRLPEGETSIAGS
jgi:hypothetical protein